MLGSKMAAQIEPFKRSKMTKGWHWTTKTLLSMLTTMMKRASGHSLRHSRSSIPGTAQRVMRFFHHSYHSKRDSSAKADSRAYSEEQRRKENNPLHMHIRYVTW